LRCTAWALRAPATSVIVAPAILSRRLARSSISAQTVRPSGQRGPAGSRPACRESWCGRRQYRSERALYEPPPRQPAQRSGRNGVIFQIECSEWPLDRPDTASVAVARRNLFSAGSEPRSGLRLLTSKRKP